MPHSLPLPPSVRVEGHAIVSADGMIADGDGAMPPALRNDADWLAFQAALDRAALVVLGRIGHQRHPNRGRPRLVFTRSIAGFAPDPGDPQATLFNPDGAALADVLDFLGIKAGTLAVTGGMTVFDFFLPLYDAFVLAETQQVILPAGRPCFPGGHPRTILAAAGLAPDDFELIDPVAKVSSTTWRRQALTR
jgi:hypothetical protein